MVTTTPSKAARAGPTHLPLSMVAKDLPFSKSRVGRLGVNASMGPDSEVATGVRPARTVPSGRGSYQTRFGTS